MSAFDGFVKRAEAIVTRDSEWKTVVNMPAFERATTDIRTMAAGMGLEVRIQIRPLRNG